MMRYFIILSFLFIVNGTFAQLKLDTLGWRSPVDIPILLSGNFAELRTGHFHGGIDIKTQGKEGFKLYAVQDGYISRIKVAPGGYGKAIYITHIDGYTSVYGHLSEYNIQLDRYVHDVQYKKQSYRVDIFPDKWEIPVKKGDIIGLSGNSGSSAGPHLHFEVRDSKTSRPQNGLFLGYDIQDNIAPKMYHLYAYPQSDVSKVNNARTTQVFSLKKRNGQYAMKQNDTLNVYGEVGFGLKVNEYLNNSNNRCGVYFLNMYVDGELCMQQEYDSFSFGETRYINSLMDYEENVSIKRKLYKLYREPNNPLSIIKIEKNRGIVNGEKGEVKKVKVEAIDAYGNKSSLTYYLRFKGDANPNLAKYKSKLLISWQDEFSMDSLGLKVKIPAKSFYDDAILDFEVNTKRWPGTFSPVYTFGNKTTPIHKYYNIEVPVDSVDSVLYDKLILTQIVKRDYKPVGGLYVNGMMKAKIRGLGKFVVLIDTLPPIIKALDSLDTKINISGIESLRFIIDDEFSGIMSYTATINGNWVLFEWDPKNKLITYYADAYLPDEGLCELELTVTDARGNETTFKREYEIYSEQDHDIGQ